MKNPYENLISENFKEYERGLYDRYPTFLIPENSRLGTHRQNRGFTNHKNTDSCGQFQHTIKPRICG